MLGLPDHVRALLFDLDGVLTRTAAVHAAAWADTFDEYLRGRPAPFVAFDPVTDYARYVDGRVREDGVRSFLASRELPADNDTVETLSGRKNELVLERLRRDGVEVFAGSRRYAEAARAAGLALAVVSASANTDAVLEAAGLSELFPVRVDGRDAKERGLRGKPAPDMFLEAAQRLSVAPARAMVVEDALAGVEAGRAGGFLFVVGINRAGQADALRKHGADIVVDDLAELLDHS